MQAYVPLEEHLLLNRDDQREGDVPMWRIIDYRTEQFDGRFVLT